MAHEHHPVETSSSKFTDDTEPKLLVESVRISEYREVSDFCA